MMRRLFFEVRYLFRRAPWDSGVSPPELLAFLEAHPPGRALDLGCGTGTNVITLARHGWQATGVDFSARAIRLAKRKTRAAGLEVDLRQGDVTDLGEVQAPFDLALDIGCFHSLSPIGKERYVANLSRLLRPGGTFLLYTFLRPEPGDRSGWPTEDSILQRFGQTFEITKVERGTDRHRLSAWFSLRRKS